MKNTIITFFFLGLSITLTNAQNQTDPQLTAAVDKLLAEQFKPNETGCAALVARRGQIIYKKAFGMADLELNVPMQPDMIFRIGSITKQFTAVAILQLMEQGKLSLQDEITKYLPDYPMNGHKITIEHLLTHTSGIQSYTGMKDFKELMTKDVKPEELINRFKNQPMEFAPGTKFHYNNSGYFLLGYIIEKITGKTYPQYLEETFFKPLGMTNTSQVWQTRFDSAICYGHNANGEPYELMKWKEPSAGGSMSITLQDFTKFYSTLINGKGLSKKSFKEIFG